MAGKEFKIKHALDLNNTHVVTGFTNDPNLTDNEARLVTEYAIKNYVYAQTSGITGGITVALEWKFKTSILETDPGNGNFNYNSATPSNIDKIFVDQFTKGGGDPRIILEHLGYGDVLLVQQKDDASKYVFFTVSGTTTDNTGWWTIPVIHENSGTLPDNNATCVFLLYGTNEKYLTFLQLYDVDISSYNAGRIPFEHSSGMTDSTKLVYDKDYNNLLVGTNMSTFGTNSLILGTGSAEGDHTQSLGLMTFAFGQGAHAQGWGTIASGVSSHAEGFQTLAEGPTAHAEGLMTWARAEAAHAEGLSNTAYAPSSHAEGSGTKALNEYSHAEGGNTIAANSGAHAEGYFTVASGYFSHAGGSFTIASGFSQTVIGAYNIPNGDSTISHISFVDRDDYVFIIGNGTSPPLVNSNAFAVSWKGNVFIDSGITLGLGDYADEISNDETLADASHSTLVSEWAIKNYIGSAIISGITASASTFLQLTDTIDSYSTDRILFESADGVVDSDNLKWNNTYKNLTIGDGEIITPGLTNTVIIGTGVTLSSNYSYGLGYGVIVSGEGGFASGRETTAGGAWSNASGYFTEALGDYSFAGGFQSNSYGDNSFSYGSRNTSSGDTTTSFGYQSQALGYSQFVIGLWNEPNGDHTHIGVFGIDRDEYAFIIGNGEGGSTRSNAFSVSWKGNVFITSGLTFKGSSEYVDEITEVIDASSTHHQLPTAKAVWNSDMWVLNSAITYIQTSDTFIGLEDTINEYNEHRVLFEGDTGVTDHSEFSYEPGTFGKSGIYSLFNVQGSVQEGYDTVATGYYAHAEGEETTAEGRGSHSEGYNTTAYADYSHAEGYETTAYGEYSHAEGEYTTAEGDYSHAEGSYTTTEASYSHAEGYSTTTTYDYAHAEGYYTLADYEAAHAEGYETTASGDYGSHSEGSYTTAYGESSHSEGSYTTAYGEYGSHAEGYDTTAYGETSHAEGYDTTAYGETSHAEGQYTKAIGDNGSHAEGDGSIASGYTSHAEGYDTTAYGDYSHSEGHDTTAFGESSHSEGYNNLAYGEASHTEGANTTASGKFSHAEGEYTTASGDWSHAEGESNIASGDDSHVEGYSNTASGDGAHAEGYANTASGDDSHAEGGQTTASGQYAHTEGADTVATSYTSHAEGLYTTSIGISAHAEGSGTTAIGDASHAEGIFTRAYGQYSHAEGNTTKTPGDYAHAEGYITTASGRTSHAEGSATFAYGPSSHAEGTGTYAFGEISHAEGWGTKALGRYSHSEGFVTTASGLTSHAEGNTTVASGWFSHAEGTQTTAIGTVSHAEGEDTLTIGHASHAQNTHTVASGTSSSSAGLYTTAKGYSQFVIGTFNEISGINFTGGTADISGITGWQDIIDDYVFIVGAGSGASYRTNALSVSYRGNVFIKSGLTFSFGEYADEISDDETLADESHSALVSEWAIKNYVDEAVISGITTHSATTFLELTDVDIDSYVYGYIPYEDNNSMIHSSGFTYSGGTINVNGEDISNLAIHLLGDISRDPTGWKETNQDSIMTWDDGTRTLTITPTSGSFDVYVKGRQFTFTGITQSIPDVTNFYHWYVDQNGEVQRTSIFDDVLLIKHNAYIANCDWDSDLGKALYVGDERHGLNMASDTHYELHHTQNAWYHNGLSLYDFQVDDSGNDNLSAQFTVQSGAIYDEDVKHESDTILTGSTLRLFYRTGLTWDYHESPFAVLTEGNRAVYNSESGGIWGFTEISNGDFVLAHLFATNDVKGKIVCIMGQADYLNITAAREGAAVEMNQLLLSGLIEQEFLAIATVIYQTRTNWSNDVKSRIRSTDEGDDYIDWRFARLSASAGQVSSHGTLSGLANDDHKQYALLNGRSGDTLKIDDIVEYHSNNGVSVDSVRMQDGQVKLLEGTTDDEGEIKYATKGLWLNTGGTSDDWIEMASQLFVENYVISFQSGVTNVDSGDTLGQMLYWDNSNEKWAASSSIVGQGIWWKNGMLGINQDPAYNLDVTDIIAVNSRPVISLDSGAVNGTIGDFDGDMTTLKFAGAGGSQNTYIDTSDGYMLITSLNIRHRADNHRFITTQERSDSFSIYDEVDDSTGFTFDTDSQVFNVAPFDGNPYKFMIGGSTGNDAKYKANIVDTTSPSLMLTNTTAGQANSGEIIFGEIPGTFGSSISGFRLLHDGSTDLLTIESAVAGTTYTHMKFSKADNKLTFGVGTNYVNEIVTEVHTGSTDEQVPTAKAVWTSDLWVLNSAITYIQTTDTFIGLSDTIGSYNTGRILFEDSSSVVDSDGFKFISSNVGLQLGANAVASGDVSIAGGLSTAVGDGSVAIGPIHAGIASALGDLSMTIGAGSLASGDSSFSLGYGTVAQGLNQFVIGHYNEINGIPGLNGGVTVPTAVDVDEYAFMIGKGTSDVLRSNAFHVSWRGNAFLASGLTLGTNSNYVDEIVTTVDASSTDQQLPTAKAVWDSDMWVLNSAITYITTNDTFLELEDVDIDSYIYGYVPFEHGSGMTHSQNLVYSGMTFSVFASVQEGSGSTASGIFSHAEGVNTLSSASATHTEGITTTASAQAAHAEGASTTASAQAAHAEGYSSVASGLWSHAEGNSYSLKEASHSEGNTTTAEGDYSHAEGSYTTTFGIASHSQNFGTLASGDTSTASGYKTTAKGFSQFVLGTYNAVSGIDVDIRSGITFWQDIIDDYVFIVGGGSGETFRSNALAVSYRGNVDVASGITLGLGDYANEISNDSGLTDESHSTLVSEWAIKKYIDYSVLSGVTVNTTYTNAEAVPEDIGGIEAGQTFNNVTLQDMWTDLLYPYQEPSFDVFYNNYKSNYLEVGETLAAGSITFTYGVDKYVNANDDISVTDITNVVLLADNMPAVDAGVTGVTVAYSIQKTTATSHSWQIKGTDTEASTYTRNTSRSWRWRFHWGDAPMSGYTGLTSSDILNLDNDEITASVVRSPVYAAVDPPLYKYYTFPDDGFALNNITLVGFDVDMAGVAQGYDDGYDVGSTRNIYYKLVSHTNSYGVTKDYKVYRTLNELGGNITLVYT